MKFSLVFLVCGLYAIFNSSAALIIKHKLLTYKVTNPYEFVIFLMDMKIVLAFILIIISMFFAIRALSLSQISVVIPLSTSINFIVTVIMGILFFKDTLTMQSYIGLACILIGMTVLLRSS